MVGKYNKWFVRLNWVTLVLIYLVVIAGSFVRITGSGMGCPDWPKCFGQWVPPTDADVLPENYKDIYADKREAKTIRFCNLLNAVGLNETAERILADEMLLHEEDFNARKTWTEYVNRLVGFLAGNGILFIFLWILLKYREKRLILVGGINLIALIFQAWFGSIVVATNLVPWTITVHMLMALLIIGLQLYMIHMLTYKKQQKTSEGWVVVGERSVKVTKIFYGLLFIVFLITFYQMFLGTQVREEVDLLKKMGIPRSEWHEHFGLPFLIHRSFSWLVLVLMVWMYWTKRKMKQFYLIHVSFFILVVELIGGILLAHFKMHGLVQISHLLLAATLFGTLLFALFRYKFK
ncbi:MAG: COX15/CtaA family protein [Crocinitomicaceae bacterium]|nr:COX15/CtaA family protein [Crocinitomicaceae bacterium]